MDSIEKDSEKSVILYSSHFVNFVFHGSTSIHYPYFIAIFVSFDRYKI